MTIEIEQRVAGVVDPAERHVRVLAVDDNPVDLEVLRRHLERVTDWDVELATCEEAVEALERASAGDLDLILLDYHLGSCSGLELLEQLRAREVATPAILLTVYEDADVAMEAIHAHVADYLPKSRLSPKSLGRSIGNVVQKDRMQRNLVATRDHLRDVNGQLRQKNREIESFYHSVSHELKTPLTAAKEFVSLVLEGLAGEVNAEQRDFLQTADRNLSQMVLCINDMIDVTRLETGKLAVERRRCELAEIVREVERLWHAEAEEKGIRLRVEACERSVELDADPRRVMQVFNNLVSNALKFTDRGGEVTICCDGGAADGCSFVQCAVRDTGRGIPAESLEHVFERLYQSESGDAATLGGLGLGLTICREIVRLHGGELHVLSTEGVGSTFTFTLPRYSGTTP